MLDLIAAIFATALYAILIGVLVGCSPVRAEAKLAAFAAAAAWLAITVFAAALGWLAPGTLGPIPTTLLPFCGMLALLFGGWFLLPQFRSAVLAVPLPALIAIHAGRLGGVFFLLLYADGRLSTPFAPAAGLGDMIAGSLAVLLAVVLALGFDVRRAWLGLWNMFGAMDLIAAVLLAALSMPGAPFRVFVEGPGTLVMTTLPWAFVPAMLVPIFLFIHFAIAAKTKSLPRVTHVTAMAN